MSEWPATLSKYTGLGAAIAAELTIGFTGVISAIGVVNGLNRSAATIKMEVNNVTTKTEEPGAASEVATTKTKGP